MSKQSWIVPWGIALSVILAGGLGAQAPPQGTAGKSPLAPAQEGPPPKLDSPSPPRGPSPAPATAKGKPPAPSGEEADQRTADSVATGEAGPPSGDSPKPAPGGAEEPTETAPPTAEAGEEAAGEEQPPEEETPEPSPEAAGEGEEIPGEETPPEGKIEEQPGEKERLPAPSPIKAEPEAPPARKPVEPSVASRRAEEEGPAPTPPPRPSAGEALRAVFTREPLPFGEQTLQSVREDLRNLGESLREDPSQWLVPIRGVGMGGGIILLLFALALGAGIYAERRLAPRLEAQHRKWLEGIPPPLRRWLHPVCRAAAQGLLPGGLWVLWALLSGFRGGAAWILLIRDLLGLGIGYRVLVGGLHGLLLDPDEPALPPEQAAGFYSRLRHALQVGMVLYSSFIVCQSLGYREDVAAFLFFLFHLLFASGLAWALIRREDILGLLPESGLPSYQRLLTLLRQVYYPLLGLSWGIAILWALGYRALASLFFQRGWALLGVLLGGFLLQQVGARMLREKLLPPGAPATAERLHALLQRWLNIALLLGGGWMALQLLGLAEAVVFLWQYSLGQVSGVELIPGRLITAGLGIALAAALSELVRAFLYHSVFPHTRLDEGATHALSRLLHYGLLFIAGFFALRVLGVSGSHLALIAGGLSVGVGFGLQNIANNLVSGILLLLGRELRHGDVISIGEYRGTIENIGVRATTIRTVDNLRVLIPNAQLLSEAVINRTYMDPFVRVRVPVGVTYDSDPEEVRTILEEVGRSSPWTLPDRPVEVLFKDFGDNSLNFELVVWIRMQRERDFLQAQSELHFAVCQACTERNIEIAFPQRDLHLRSGIPWEELLALLRERSGGPAPGDDAG